MDEQENGRRKWYAHTKTGMADKKYKTGGRQRTLGKRKPKRRLYASLCL